MKIGFDIDGVFADFNTPFIDRVVAETGVDLFPPRPFDTTTWNYPKSYGYTGEQVSAVWASIKADPTFWLKLPPYWDAMTLLERVRAMAPEHELTFITSRPGVQAKEQTEVWLATHAGDFEWEPNVIVSSEKGKYALELGLRAYVDDRLENVVDVVRVTHERTLTCLLDRPWNQTDTLDSRVVRISSVNDMLDVLTSPARP